jgi:hypothetical protein
MFIGVSEDIEEAQMRDISNFIRKIYDDFENRTCESCRFFLGCGLENCNCANENSMGYTYPDLTKFDSCNKWESKNDNR